MWHVWGDRITAYKVFWGDRTERDRMENLDVDGRTILKWIFKKWTGEAWTGLLWFRIGTRGRRL